MGLLLKLLGIFVAFVAVGLAYSFYAEGQVTSFCESIPMNATPKGVSDAARAAGMISVGQAENSNTVVAVNHLAPYFRFSCELTLEAGKVVSREVKSSD
jgi:hypothetical protein